MTKRRGIAITLLLMWLLLAAGPVAFAATGKCCPVCTQNMCPMKKGAHPNEMPCHDMMTKSTCHLQAGACNRDLNGLVFSFTAILPVPLPATANLILEFVRFDCKLAIDQTIEKFTPPPRLRFA